MMSNQLVMLSALRRIEMCIGRRQQHVTETRAERACMIHGPVNTSSIT